MAGFSDYLENAVLNHLRGGTAFAQPSALYVALFTVAPTDAGGGTEVSGGSYARTVATFGAAAAGVITNSSPVTFPKATADWMSGNPMLAFAVFDAASGGNMLAWNTLSAPNQKAILLNDTAVFETGALTVSLD